MTLKKTEPKLIGPVKTEAAAKSSAKAPKKTVKKTKTPARKTAAKRKKA